MLSTHLRHAIGVLLLVAAVTPLAMAATRVVAGSSAKAPRALRAAGGAALAVAFTQLLLTLLGVIGLLKLIPILVLVVGVGMVGLALSPPHDHTEAAEDGSGGPGRPFALFAMSLVGLQWASWTVVALNQGVQRDDSLTYHLPTALAFASSGSVTTPVMTVAGSPVGYYTNGMEILHALGIIVVRNDVFTCFSGLAFAALAVIACWTIGARFGRGWLAALFACLVLALPAVVQTQAGSALVDLPAAALVLTALALAVWADYDRRWAFLPPVLVAGAALAAKLLVLPVVVVVLGYVLWQVLGTPDPRRWTGSDLARCGFAVVGVVIATVPWLVRNAASVGSPLPMVNLPGFDHATFPQVTALGKSVGSYLKGVLTYPDASHGLKTALRSAMGGTWPLLVVGLGLLVLAGVRRWRVAPVVVVAFLAAAVGYLAAPFGAGGPGVPPFLLSVNVRYAVLALLLAAPLVAVLLRTELATKIAAGVGAVLLVLTILPNDVLPGSTGYYRLDTWPRAEQWILVVIGVVIGVAIGVGATVGGDQLRRGAARLPRASSVLAAAAVIALVVVGFVRNDFASHFTAAQDLSVATRYAESLSHERIGLVGVERSYPFAGRNLTNRVQTMLVVDADGVPKLPLSCAQLRGLIAKRGSTIIIGKAYRLGQFDDIACISALPGAKPLGRTGTIYIWRLNGSGQ